MEYDFLRLAVFEISQFLNYVPKKPRVPVSAYF